METKELSETIEKLRTTFWSGKTRSEEWRRSQLLALRRMLDEHESEFNLALRTDIGKGDFECYLTEIGFLYREIDHALRYLKEWMRPIKTSTPIFLQPARSKVIFEPLGVALIMGAWNYPLNLTLGPLVAAIAAGNAAVIKAPRTARTVFDAVGHILPAYLDREAFLVIDDDTPNDLILEQRFDKIFYTGSAETGKIVMAAAVKNLTPVTLELGGKSPAIVERTANLKVAAHRIVQGKFFNAGQTCVAPDYILAQEEIADKLTDELAKTLVEFYGEDPHKSEDFARIINTKQFDNLVKYFSDGDLVCGGKAVREERYIAPTILKNVSADAPVMQKEIFGPILPILKVKDMDEALKFVQGREKPLAFYFFSENRAMAEKMIAGSTSGGACINETVNHVAVGGLPFGGVGYSGMGKYHGEWGFKDFSNARALLDHDTSFDPALRYPPYKAENLQTMKKMMSMHIPDYLDGLVRWLTAHFGEFLIKFLQ